MFSLINSNITNIGVIINLTLSSPQHNLPYMDLIMLAEDADFRHVHGLCSKFIMKVYTCVQGLWWKTTNPVPCWHVFIHMGTSGFLRGYNGRTFYQSQCLLEAQFTVNLPHDDISSVWSPQSSSRSHSHALGMQRPFPQENWSAWHVLATMIN